jgi:hypothetical protein
MTHALFLQYFVGTCKNNTSVAVTLPYKFICKKVIELRLYQKLDTCQIFMSENQVK